MSDMDRLIKYMHGDLRTDAQAKLTRMAEFPLARDSMKVWDTHDPQGTTWWYEGPVRNVVADLVSRWVDEHADEDELLVLAEQRIPRFPELVRADIAINAKDGRWAFVEIKADFNLAGIDRDAGKLVDAQAELGKLYCGGLLAYVVKDDSDTIARWQAQLTKALGHAGVAVPLVRKPPSHETP
jgi:hypothetical protein